MSKVAMVHINEVDGGFEMVYERINGEMQWVSDYASIASAKSAMRNAINHNAIPTNVAVTVTRKPAV